jgi:hypothetical protein
MEIERMKIYCIITFKSVSLHVNDSLTYMTEEGDNKIYSLMDIHSILFITVLMLKRNFLFPLFYRIHENSSPILKSNFLFSIFIFL